MALDLINEKIRTHLAPYGKSLESRTVRADPTTIYQGYARAGSRTTDAKWIIWRIKTDGTSVTTRMARTDANTNDQEEQNKIMSTPEIYDYVES